MKIISIIARYLLGLLFTVFGLNGFLQFIHQPPPTEPQALQFLVAVSASHFAAFFFAVQVLGGLLLLSGYFVPLALILLAAELYNILAFHLMFQSGSGIGPGLLACVLWVLGFPPISCKLQGRPHPKAGIAAISATRPLLFY